MNFLNVTDNVLKVKHNRQLQLYKSILPRNKYLVTELNYTFFEEINILWKIWNCTEVTTT